MIGEDEQPDDDDRVAALAIHAPEGVEARPGPWLDELVSSGSLRRAFGQEAGRAEDEDDDQDREHDH